MISKKKIVSFTFDSLVGEIYAIGNNKYTLEANYMGSVPANVHIYAPNPKPKSYGTDHLNFDVAYPNMQIAFENTVNIAHYVLTGQRTFHFEFEMPNCYYHDGKIVLPHLFIRISDSDGENKFYIPIKRKM